MQTVPRVAIVGGGVSGLATARFLRDGVCPPEVTVLEADDRLGGKVFTQSLAGMPVDTGPDAVLTRVPAMLGLVDELGLTDAIAAPAPSGVYLWSRGQLRRLPAGSMFGVPDRIVPLLRSRLLSPRGVARAGLDVVLPRRVPPADATVAQLIEPRFGSEVLDRLIEPLIGGVHAGSARLLSASSAVPDIDALVRGNRSVFLALRRRRRQAGTTPSGPALVSFDGGLDRLIAALRDSLADCQLRTGCVVEKVEQTSTGYRLTLDDGTAVEADAVVFATPAYVTADLVESLAPAASQALRTVPYVDVATVTLAYPRSAQSQPLDATGFLVPPCEGRLLTGCTWLSSKWAHLSDGPMLLIRGMVGRVGDNRWMSLDDDALVQRVHDELVESAGFMDRPAHALVQRWPQAIPQYTVGHAERVRQVDGALATAPGLFLSGAAYRGAGIASCVATAARTATQVLDHITTAGGTS